MIAPALVALLHAAVQEPGPEPWLVELAPTLELALEVDTNARRLPEGSVDTGGATPGKSAVVPDGLVRAQGALAFDAARPGLQLHADAAGGLKLFATEAAERMAVAQGRASLAAALPLDVTGTLQAYAKGRGQASLARSYVVAGADAGLQRPLPWGFSVHGALAGTSFHAVDAAVVTSMTTAARLGVGYAVTAFEHLDLTGDAGLRVFPFAAAGYDVDTGQPLGPQRRLDAPLSLALTATSARRLFLSGTWSWERSASNSRGESYSRHRLTGLVGFKGPEEITCTAQGALQLTQYDDGVSLGQRYFLGVDDESQNLVQLMVARPWRGGVTLEGRLLWTGNELAREGARFSRATAAVGVRVEL